MGFVNINETGKVIMMLCIAERIMESIGEQDEDYVYCRDSLNMCWDWVKDKKISKVCLCERISSDDKCLADIVMSISDDDLSNKYASILTCISYVAWQAYNYDKDYFYPQDLECIDDEYLEEFIEQLIEENFISDKQYSKVIGYFESNQLEESISNTKKKVINMLSE